MMLLINKMQGDFLQLPIIITIWLDVGDIDKSCFQTTPLAVLQIDDNN